MCRAVLDGGDEVLAGLYKLQVLVIALELGHPPLGLLNQPQLVSEDVVHDPIKGPTDGGRFAAGNTQNFLHVGYDRDNLVPDSLGLLDTQTVLRWMSADLTALTFLVL